MILSRDSWLAAVAAAARAPSPHNAQPARWHLHGDQVQLFGDASGWLSASDPTGRDDCIALGMAWESMTLALSTRGCELRAPTIAPAAEDRSKPLRLVASGTLVAGARDALGDQQERRRCYRGKFAPASAKLLQSLDACVAAHTGIARPLPSDARDAIAARYDGAAADGLRNREVASELYRYMRFSRRDPRWQRDGLAADCLMLGGFEAWGASILMRPVVLGLLGRLGLSGLVVSERSKVASAARLVAIHGNGTAFETGRRWYRFWLDLTAIGCAAVPMSALADSPRHAAALNEMLALPAGQRLFNVMRVGPAPETPAPPSARRPAEELILTTV